MVPRFRRLIAGIGLAGLAVFALCIATHKRDSRLSAAVALVTDDPRINPPGRSVVEAWARFPANLGEDVLFGIDQEFLDGVKSPRFVRGGDWMGLVAVMRGGSIWVAKGTADTLAGKISSDRTWEIIPLGQPLKPDTWYRLRSEVNFATRHYLSFTIQGPGLDRTIKLDAYSVDYPNMIPMDRRAMSYFVFAMRGRSMMKSGQAKVYFDDVKAGVVKDSGQFAPAFQNSFENIPPIGDQPITSPVIDLGKYKERQWYKERQDSIVSSERASFARTGSWVGVADARLDD